MKVCTWLLGSVRVHACVCVANNEISECVWQFIHKSFDLVLVANLNTEFLVESSIERAVKTGSVVSIPTFVLTEDA